MTPKNKNMFHKEAVIKYDRWGGETEEIWMGY